MKIFVTSIQANCDSYIRSLSGVMNGSERRAYSCINNKRFRAQYLTSSILKRYFLSVYCDWQVSPTDWEFEKGTAGKPSLSKNLPQPPLEFNVTHCDSLFAMAVQDKAPVGIDVESTDILVDETLADMVFTARERALLADFSPGDRQTERIKLWTDKEAYLKYLGVGLQKDLRAYDIPSLLHPSANNIETGAANIFLRNWTIECLGSSYSVSVAADNRSVCRYGVQLSCFTRADHLESCFIHTRQKYREARL